MTSERSEYYKKYHEEHRDERVAYCKLYNDSHREKQRKRGENARDVLNKLKIDDIVSRGGKCSNPDCNYKYDGSNLAAFQYHHRDPKTKLYNVASMCFQEDGVVKEEMLKCDVYCANCHILLHVRGLYEQPV